MTKSRVALTALALLFMAQTSFASGGSGGGSGLWDALEIEHSGGIRFGHIAPNLTQSGTVEIATNGTRTCASSITCFNTSATGASTFDVTGQLALIYVISVPDEMTLNGIGGASGHSMTATLEKSKLLGLLDLTGDIFNVGGTLTVGANQQVGTYSGSYTVTVEYQ